MPEEITPPAPRVLTLTGAPHPNALVQSVDAATGVCVFAWLNAEGAQVDSGGSIARFTPVPLPLSPDDAEISGITFAKPSDADLATAIANPITLPTPVPTVIRAAALRYVLNTQGLRATVEAAVAAADQNTKDAWEFETNIRRDHPLIAAFSAGLGLTSAQVDAMFRAAAEL